MTPATAVHHAAIKIEGGAHPRLAGKPGPCAPNAAGFQSPGRCFCFTRTDVARLPSRQPAACASWAVSDKTLCMPIPKERKTWQQFEDLVERIHRKLHKRALVTRNAKILGRISKSVRQIDVSIRYQLGPVPVLMIVECKRHRTKIDTPLMSSFIGTMQDVGAHAGVMVSERGFTKGAVNMAKQANVSVYKLRDTTTDDWLQNMKIHLLVENCTISVGKWGVVNLDGSTPEIAQHERLELFDAREPEREIPANELLRRVWIANGKKDGEFCHLLKPRPATIPGGEQEYALFFKYRVETIRFARDASLELMGLTDENRTTHTDAFKIVTKPGGVVRYFSDPDFWRKSDAFFAVTLKATNVLWSDQRESSKQQAQRMILEKLPEHVMEITATAGEKPIAINFDPDPPKRKRKEF